MSLVVSDVASLTGDNPCFPVIYDPPWVSIAIGTVSLGILATALCSLALLYARSDRPWKNLFVVSWIIGPPIYAVFNYHVLFRYLGRPEAFDHYVRSQTLWTPAWVAIGAAAVLIVTGQVGRRN